ncbi:unnamed protein product [Rotaria sordida]|uniref:Potassium channel domain-containing protein n=2 Tax=Rotaria sordida TaxID=392033 RepID=A0A813S2K0_9BILA|nr:unnamed protein product [Rotaria sordida]CAF0793188.1 unnamed protein product [Rotaria sordida]CAF0794633.1 unnamed protein product [Rotaria sordida]CAF0833860.1 unnamed protein product [Rotaria sordida]
MKKQNVRTLTLIVSTFSYLLVGAAIFDALESNTEDMLRKQYQKAEASMLHSYNISETEYTELEDIVIKYQPHKAGAQWKFPGAFYFSLTVITTIGYGHSCPTTIWGKSFCMLYAVIGIPLCLVMFQSVGERLNNFASWCIKTIKKCIKLRHYDTTQTELVIVGTVLAVGVVTGGAAMFRHYETWDYFDCVYYCFITLTTIGFGDFVALQTNEALNTNIFYVVLSMTFILFGLTVVASSMNLLVLRFLTMNTEDERREEIQSAVARNSLRFDSDLISPNGTLIPYPSPDQFEYLSTEITPSESEPCHCFSCFKHRQKERKKFTVRRMPGKIAHLVPMQRLDSAAVRRAFSIGKPSNTDYNLQTSTKLLPMTTTSVLGGKSSTDDSPTTNWPPPFSYSSTSHPPIHTSASIGSLKPSYEQATNVNNITDSENILSQTRLQTMLSNFRQDVELNSYRLDVKRSSV